MKMTKNHSKNAKGEPGMYRRPRPRLRTLSLTLGALVALFGASTAHATDPEACSAEPADEVPAKRVALFDVYWNNSSDNNDPNSKTLVNNPCPPTVVHNPAKYDDRDELITPASTTRTASKIHIDHTIIHIPESTKLTVTNSNLPSDEYSGGYYNFLRREPDVNGVASYANSADVYIVPACGRTATNPSLCLGASAGLLTPGDWGPDPANRSEGTKIQYKFTSIREPGHATQGWGNVFVFKIKQDAEGAWRPNIIWRTDNTDINEWKLAPGTYDYAYWAFTEPGTYVFQVQAEGHPNKQRAGGPIVNATTVTSEVREYTFHVGNLPVNHQPLFNVTRSVPENSAAGTNVGAPILVKDLDAETVCFALRGLYAHENFTISGTTDATKCGTLTAVNRSGDDQMSAQIQVKANADLDYEGIDFYDLKLLVSDGQDHESNADLTIDDSILVSISLTDDPTDNPTTLPSISLAVNHPSASAEVGTAGFDLVGTQTGLTGKTRLRYQFVRTPHAEQGFHNSQDLTTPVTVKPTHNGTWQYWIRAIYREGNVTKRLESNRVRVTWPWPSE